MAEIEEEHLEETIICRKCWHRNPVDLVRESNFICPLCGSYLRMPPYDRIDMLVDEGTFEELYSGVRSKDFMNFPEYQEKIDDAILQTGENEGVVVGTAQISGHECLIFCMDTRFIMASLGNAMGEKITRGFEFATRNHLPVIGVVASGGARMQEGILSLMQMAKCSGAIKKHSDSGNLYLALLTDPTTGGVTASIAMLADIIFAEPKALIGFAGRRVIEQTTGEKLADNFQSAEFMLEHGLIDGIVSRSEQRKDISSVLNFFE